MKLTRQWQNLWMEKDGTYDISALVSVILQAQFHPFSKVI
jgi:hypothetical protein